MMVNIVSNRKENNSSLSTIIQGIQRSLETIFNDTKSIYTPHCPNTPALNRSTLWDFLPDNRIHVTYTILFSFAIILDCFFLLDWGSCSRR